VPVKVVSVKVTHAGAPAVTGFWMTCSCGRPEPSIHALTMSMRARSTLSFQA